MRRMVEGLKKSVESAARGLNPGVWHEAEHLVCGGKGTSVNAEMEGAGLRALSRSSFRRGVMVTAALEL